MDNNNNDDLDAMFNDDNPTPPEEPTTPPADPAPAEPAKPPAPKPGPQEPKGVVEPPKPGEEQPKPEDGKPGEGEAKKGAPQGQDPNAEGKPAEGQDQPPAPQPPQEPPKPLTREDLRQVINDMQTEQKTSAQALQSMEESVLNAYYPQGLSNVLTDEKTGRELRTPQDVVDVAREQGNEISIEEASQWLMNEQYKLDNQIKEIKDSARGLAETNANFRSGATRVMEIYKPIFDRYPQLQQKIYKSYMKNVKMDSEKDLIISAPDIEDFYRDFMEPYVLAFGHEDRQKPATSAAPAAPGDPAKPTIPDNKQTPEDRMDVGGDGGSSGSDEADPNDPEDSLNHLFKE